jgi:hypothetical protein
LQYLFDQGFAFFLLDERRDLLLPKIPGLPEPIQDHIDDWRVRHYFVVRPEGCFRLSPTAKLHRFNESCAEARDGLFQLTKDRCAVAHVFNNAVIAAAVAHTTA